LQLFDLFYIGSNEFIPEKVEIDRILLKKYLYREEITISLRGEINCMSKEKNYGIHNIINDFTRQIGIDHIDIFMIEIKGIEE